MNSRGLNTLLEVVRQERSISAFLPSFLSYYSGGGGASDEKERKKKKNEKQSATP